jgi:hypothetical protein
VQALHKPTKGELVSRHPVMQALQHDGGWNKQLCVSRRSQDRKGSPDAMRAIIPDRLEKSARKQRSSGLLPQSYYFY